MNKIILGSVLITIMGGTPTATYFLTKDSSEEKENPIQTDQRTTSVRTDISTAACPSQGNKQTCPEA